MDVPEGRPRSHAEAAALGKRLADEGHGVGWPMPTAAPSFPPLFPCCNHCGCGTPDGDWPTREGHDDICAEGCNDDE